MGKKAGFCNFVWCVHAPVCLSASSVFDPVVFESLLFAALSHDAALRVQLQPRPPPAPPDRSPPSDC